MFNNLISVMMKLIAIFEDTNRNVRFWGSEISVTCHSFYRHFTMVW